MPDVGKLSLWSSKGCAEALLRVFTPPAPHPSICVCVLLHSLTVCHVHAAITNTPFHEPSHMISRSVPMHWGGQLTFVSSWYIMILCSLPRVHLVLPLLPQGRPAQLAGHLDQAAPACPGAKLPGSQRRSHQATTFFFIPIPKTAPAPEGIIFLACDDMEGFEHKLHEPGFESQSATPWLFDLGQVPLPLWAPASSSGKWA